MYYIVISKGDVIKASNHIDMVEKLYNYIEVHGGDFGVQLFKDSKAISLEEYEQWASLYDKYFKEKQALKDLKKDFV